MLSSIAGVAAGAVALGGGFFGFFFHHEPPRDASATPMMASTSDNGEYGPPGVEHMPMERPDFPHASSTWAGSSTPPDWRDGSSTDGMMRPPPPRIASSTWAASGTPMMHDDMRMASDSEMRMPPPPFGSTTSEDASSTPPRGFWGALAHFFHF